MTKHMIRVPEMIQQIGAAKFRPNVVVIFLIAIVIYIAYFIASVFGGIIFVVVFFTGNSFDSISDMISGMFTSPSVILFSLFYTAVLIVLTIVYVRFIGKRPLSTMGLGLKRLPVKYAAGFALGTGALLLTLLPSILFEGITFVGFTPLVVLYLLAFMIQSASEEVFFRGYLMSSVASRIGIVWAVVISSALFSLLHIFNGDYSLLGGISIMLIGALLALYTLRTNSLWGACGFHAAWNFVSGLLDRFDIGGFSVDYAAFNIGGTQSGAANQGFVGDPFNIYYIAVFLLAIALILFAGKNKLVVKRPPAPELPESPEGAADSSREEI